MKVHDSTTKIFRCMVCHKNDQRQKSNWRQHVATHIGQEIPPDVFEALDHETKAILTGTHERMKRGFFEQRLTKAEAKRPKGPKQLEVPSKNCRLKNFGIPYVNGENKC
ncbi:uncharacterized protein LOC131892275 [Tigriopus californicus]|uniref:uncharacterized protein LOC131892275 n=1 Tax=Tigriopus californicus TaxID=6832 RepID=UPI0027D9F4E4|nr:uncharacterized protein LOC131892275 [Tigriopus californicus]